MKTKIFPRQSDTSMRDMVQRALVCRSIASYWNTILVEACGRSNWGIFELTLLIHQLAFVELR